MEYRTSWQDASQTKLLLELDGKLLFGNFQKLQSLVFSLREKPPAQITFDLRNVDMIDSSGLGLLIVANEIATNVTLKYPSKQVEQLFEVCKIGELMEIVL
ncbi:STAS domain-containing protein [Terasakiella sp. A23]|uniref:STAS domain-containing protein n=1 Tax=Terasakiella sp. FCG-A23 TaxID=3080561 RepID=UPI00295511DC|nr:STAS domain-containing protein [Terasakiella sp. A23]MDV7338285.1 STAS domain-containing protein [Terasakiella sp. A23]